MSNDRKNISMLPGGPEVMAAMRRFNAQSTHGFGAVGQTGERGLSLISALTQALEKSVSVNNTEQVRATMQFGLVENLKPHQTSFENKEARQLIQALMKNSSTIRSEITAADHASKDNQLSTSFTKSKHADFGKIKATGFQVAKLKFSDSPDALTADAGNASQRLMDDSNAALTGAPGLGQYRQKKSGEKINMPDSDTGTADLQHVFVTSGTVGMLTGGEPFRKNHTGKNGALLMSDNNGKPGNISKATSALGVPVGLPTAFDVGCDVYSSGVRDGLDALVSKFTGEETTLGLALYELINREQEPTRVIVEVQNGNIAASVEQNQRQAARRH